MNCGLPTFATNQGGPAEIIVDGVSGFHVDPNNDDESSNKVVDFFEKCKVDAEYWNKEEAITCVLFLSLSMHLISKYVYN
ncbi:unnamed protein product [Camellia sinensis]